MYPNSRLRRKSLSPHSQSHPTPDMPRESSPVSFSPPRDASPVSFGSVRDAPSPAMFARNTSPVQFSRNASPVSRVSRSPSPPLFVRDRFCDKLTRDECAEYQTKGRIPLKVVGGKHVKNAIETSCSVCCHTNCKNIGVLRIKKNKKTGKEEATNCLCDTHYKNCSQRVEHYKYHSKEKGDILSTLEYDEELGRDYMDAVHAGKHCESLRDKKTCEESSETLDKLYHKYNNKQIHALGAEIEGRRQYMLSCLGYVFDNHTNEFNKPSCVSSETHLFYMKQLEHYLERALYMQRHIKGEQNRVDDILSPSSKTKFTLLDIEEIEDN